MNKIKTYLVWSELKKGDFFLDIGYRQHNYGIKISDNMYFDLEENKLHRKLKTKYEMPRYIKCDYEVW